MKIDAKYKIIVWDGSVFEFIRPGDSYGRYQIRACCSLIRNVTITNQPTVNGEPLRRHHGVDLDIGGLLSNARTVPIQNLNCLQI